MRRLAILSTLFVFTPLFVFAHGNAYLEFSPDQSESLKVADVDTPSQVFYAQNDFLGAIDFWVSNPGSSGTATFALLNDSGNVLTSKTVNIPTIAETDNGTPLHVDFNSQVSVLADHKYSVRITTAMPELRLYYSDRIRLVSYTTPYVSEYITGVGKLGPDDQTFSFKHVLYETNETSAPIISNTTWSVVSSNEMKVEFNANEPVDYRIDYGPSGQGNALSTAFLNDYQFCATGIATCKLNIQVVPNTTYQYTLTAKDSWGNQSQATGTFESGQGQTPTPTPSATVTATPTPTGSVTPTPSSSPSPSVSAPPVALAISNLRAVNITGNSADISWTTNEAATSRILLSRELDFSLVITSAFDPTMELEHLLPTEAVLIPGTTYLVRITSTNSTNSVTASLSFTTSLQVPSPTPAPSQPPQIIISSTLSGDGSNTSTVRWNPPSGGAPVDGYRVDIFDKDGNFIKTVNVPAGSTSASVPGLKEGDYTVIVYANNNGVYEKVAQPAKLKVEPSFLNRLLGFWPYLLVAIGLIVGLSVWNKFKKKPTPQITTKVLPS